MATERLLCPSSRCEAGSLLLGIVLGDGRVALASDLLVVDEEFVRVAHEVGEPEKRFRFSSKCVKGGCRQWTGDRCGVIDAVLDHVGPADPPSPRPACAIRDQCRWFHQSGDRACAACPLIVTDARDPVEEGVSSAGDIPGP